MAIHPLNLIVRLLLELGSLVVVGYWGWWQGDGILRYILMIGLPVICMVVWAGFGLPDDPSRGDDPWIPVSGWIRLIIELAFFGFAAWALVDLNLPGLAALLGGVTVTHYLFSTDRVRWMLRQKLE